MDQNNSYPSEVADSEDLVLAQFLLALEKDGLAALADYSRRYPHLGDKFCNFLAKQERLERGLQEAQAGPAPVPQKLGDFRILRRIGAGGMGEVYLAEQERLHRQVVVKVMRRVHGFAQSRERFVREQEVLSRLEQAHIVPIITSGEDNGSPYIVMRHIEGASLDHVIHAAQQWQSMHVEQTPSLSVLANSHDNTAAEMAQVSTLLLDPEQGHSVSAGIANGHPRKKNGNADADRKTTSIGSRKWKLSAEYFRSVAEVMVDVAEAVQHAHSVGILHRDLKPSNLILDKSGQCWVIDFGLAGLLPSPGQEIVERSMGELDRSPRLTQGGLGTPQYMAPEQYAGIADVRSDVWGLGATLYELLTLQRAFPGRSQTEIQQQVCSAEPVPSTDRIRNVPRDLTAICLKALQKDSALRYASAGQLAADLRNWLDHRPTTASRASVIRQMELWSHRNAGWAATIACGILASAALVWGVISNEQAKAAAAEQRENEQQFKAAGAQQLQNLQLQRERTAKHELGWSAIQANTVAALVGQLAEQKLRDAAVATLNGLDGQKIWESEKVAASSVAFDASGTRILVGGSPAGTHRSPVTNASVRESVTGKVVMVSDQPGPGPVAFGEDGRPLHVSADVNDAAILRLWDIAGQRLIREFTIPTHDAFRVSGSSMTLALTPTGSFLAASAVLENATTQPVNDEKQPAILIVWDTRSGNIIRQIDDLPATALAFTPDGNWLATGHQNGKIQVFPLPQGEPISWTNGRFTVESLAFGVDVRRRETEQGRASAWLLASGDAGGEISIWDSQAQKLTSCRGSIYHVFTLAFSADHMTLASAGRGNTKIWDVATGEQLLGVSSSESATSTAFSQDGQWLATTGRDLFGPAWLSVQKLEQGRGVQTLRGLREPAAKMVFSPDGRWVAALATNWEAGIWDRRTGYLKHVLETPIGETADNSALVFSPDGNQFAFSSGSEARLWDVESGNQLKSWKLPAGFVDNLAFHPQGKLLLFRVEKTEQIPPYGNLRQDVARVCRVRDLLGANPLQPLYERQDFARRVKNAIFAPDGSYLVVADAAAEDGINTLSKAYDGLTGIELWSNNRLNVDSLRVDPTGKLLVAIESDQGRLVAHLLEPSSGREIRSAETHGGTQALSPRLEYSIQGSRIDGGAALCPGLDPAALVTLALDFGINPNRTFDFTGTHVAVGTEGTSVLVYDLPEVRRRLAQMHLDW